MSPRALVHAFALALALAGCRSATDSGEPPVALRGEWRYAATQGAPAGATLQGTLVVTRQAGTDFDGTLDVRETDARGQVRQLAGVVSGRALDATTLDFDAFLGLAGRRHVGTVASDTVTGSWLEGTSGTTASGTFRMERVR